MTMFMLQSELGRPLRRCFTLPNETFVYGRPNLTLDGGAAEAMTTKEPIPIYKRKEKALQRDFIALNRGAVTSGLVTAKVTVFVLLLPNCDGGNDS